MIRTLLILSMLSFVSCTVTKRVHRKGFHVEWKKNYATNAKTSEKRTSNTTASVAKQEVGGRHQTANRSDTLLNAFEPEIGKTPTPRAGATDANKEMGALSSKQDLDADFDPLQKIKSPKTTTKRRSVPRVDEEERKKDSGADEVLKVFGIVLLLFGIMLLVASFVILFGFTGFGGLFNALVFSGNGFLVGFLGFLLFLLIVLLVIVFVVIVQYVFGGAYVGFIVGTVLVVLGIVLLIVSAVIG